MVLKAQKERWYPASTLTITTPPFYRRICRELFSGRQAVDIHPCEVCFGIPVACSRIESHRTAACGILAWKQSPPRVRFRLVSSIIVPSSASCTIPASWSRASAIEYCFVDFLFDFDIAIYMAILMQHGNFCKKGAAQTLN
jgi:hypothetical protein